MEEIKSLFKKAEATLEVNHSGLPFPHYYSGFEDFTTYLKKFNRIATCQAWIPSRCAQILPLYLTGSALAIYEEMSDVEKKSWKTLVEGLEKRLRKTSTKEVSRQKLIERRQKEGETVEEFAQGLRDLVERAYPDSSLELDFSRIFLNAEAETNLKVEQERMAKNFRDEQCRQQFRSGLLPEIREKVIFMKEPGSLEDAVAQARKVEELTYTLKEDILKKIKKNEVKEALAEINEIRLNQDQYEYGSQDEEYEMTDPYNGQTSNFFDDQWREELKNNQEEEEDLDVYDQWREEWGDEEGDDQWDGDDEDQLEEGETDQGKGGRINASFFPYICILALICILLPVVDAQEIFDQTMPIIKLNELSSLVEKENAKCFDVAAARMIGCIYWLY